MTGTLTTWEKGRLDGKAGRPAKLLFGRMYEDAAIELDAFGPGGRIFSIASAGCTAIELARYHEVLAVDINPVQLAYAKRRFAGEPNLCAAAERFMSFGRVFAPLVGWWPSRIREFLDLDDPAAQIAYWRQYLNTRLFRIAFDGLFSMTALGTVYAPTLLEFLPKPLGPILRRRMERCFARHANRTNPFARALLCGELSDDSPPPEAKKIQTVHADAATYLEQVPPGSFDGFTLSNILDGADLGYERRLFAAIRRAAVPGAMVVLRSFREEQSTLPTNQAAKDRSMLWGSVDVRPVEMLPVVHETRKFIPQQQCTTVITRVKTPASIDQVWERLLFYEDIKKRPPLHLRLLLPIPIRTEGSKSKVGSHVMCLYKSGSLIKRVIRFDPGQRYDFEIIAQDFTFMAGLRLLGGGYTLDPLPCGRTQISVQTRYVSFRGPRWLCKPIEEIVCHLFHRYIVGAMLEEIRS